LACSTIRTAPLPITRAAPCIDFLITIEAI
jgi:hypothetical protein